jgi:hypothetical protein
MMLSHDTRAWQQFYKALELSIRIGAVGLTLGVLVDVAKLLMKAQMSSLAVEILLFINKHPVTANNTRSEANLLLKEMDACPSDRPDAAQRNIEEMINYILLQGNHIFT